MWFRLTRHAKTLDQFLALVDKYDCDQVTVAPYVREEAVSYSWTVGALGTFEHGITYRATGPKSTVVYREKLASIFGSARGFADAQKRELQALRDILTAKSRLEHLMRLRPNLSANLTTHSGQLSDELQRQLVFDAKKHNVEPYALSGVTRR